MSDLENKISVLRLDYSNKLKLAEFTRDKYKAKFHWRYYIEHYKEFQLKTLDDAWSHWVKKGVHLKYKFFVNNDITDKQVKLKYKDVDKNVKFKRVNKNDYMCSQPKLNISYSNLNDPIISTTLLRNYDNIIYKNTYDNYGVQYYGWKKVFTNFTQEFITELKTTTNDNKLYDIDQLYLLDEWAEKLLIWGNANETKYIISEIIKNNYKLITFIHNPPFVKWYDPVYKANIKNNIIYNDDYTNKKLFELINKYNLSDRITYLYTLSKAHKEYLFNKVPAYKNKLLSVFHPIQITGEEKVFDFNLFTQNRQIIHIGWQLRNFKKFIDLKLPQDFFKTILIKTGFEKEWDNMSHNYELDAAHKEYITILKELKNADYEKIFVNSCVFLYLEDCVVTNTVLECMKFNTPVIINKLPSIVEYLGENYPLYYENDVDLANLKNSNYLLASIKKAAEYLQNMDKSHISEKTFYDKVNYDIQKLNSKGAKLTWFCYIDCLDNVSPKLHNLYNDFCSQLNNANNYLQIIIDETLKPDPNVINVEYTNFIAKLDMFQELVNNIRYKFVNVDTYSKYINLCFNIAETPLITFVDLDQHFYPQYSIVHSTYMKENQSCDIAFSSYKVTHTTFNENFIFDANSYVFTSNYSKYVLPYNGIVFRKHIANILVFNEVDKFENNTILFRDFCLRAITSQLNIGCCSNEILFVNNHR
jgi:hypothetical protein